MQIHKSGRTVKLYTRNGADRPLSAPGRCIPIAAWVRHHRRRARAPRAGLPKLPVPPSWSPSTASPVSSDNLSLAEAINERCSDWQGASHRAGSRGSGKGLCSGRFRCQQSTRLCRAVAAVAGALRGVWAAEPLAAPEVVADWIATRAVSGKYGHGGQSVATLRMAIAAIPAAHAAADQPFHSRHRAITLVMRGIAREKAELPAQAAPLQAKLIVEILAELGDSPLERRATQPSWRSAIAFRVDAPSWPAWIMPSLVAVMASSRSQPRASRYILRARSAPIRAIPKLLLCPGKRTRRQWMLSTAG